MRSPATVAEELAPVPFVLLAGGAGGIMLGASALPVVQESTASAIVVRLLLGLIMILVWWAGVRRRRFSVWRTAWHLMLAWDVAHVLGLLLVVAIVGARGDMRAGTPWPESVGIVLSALIVLSPVRFMMSAALVARGRRSLPGSGGPVVPESLTPSDHAAAT